MNSTLKFCLYSALLLLPLGGQSQSGIEDIGWELETRIDETIFVNTDSAYYYAEKLLQLGIDSSDSIYIASGYQSIGHVHYYKNDLNEALIYFNKALVLYQELDMPDYVGGIYMALGNVYGDQGDYGKCLSYYEKAEELFNIHQEYPEDMAILYYNIAHIFMDLNDDHNLNKYINKSVEIIEKEEINYLLPAIYNMKAHLALIRKNYDRAEELAKKALDGSRSEKDLIEQGFALENLGIIAMARGDFQKAIRYLDTSVDVSESYGDPYIIAPQKALLASAFLKNGNLAEAEALGVEAYQSGISQNSALITKKVSEVYAAVLERKGEHKNALAIYKVYTRAKDTLNGFEVSEKLLRSQNRISEQQNQLLKAEASLLKTNNSRGKILIIATSVALILSMMIIMLMIINLRARKQAAIALKAKQQLIDDKSGELEKKNAELQRINTGKDKLFSIITHDMKEPFNQISSFLHLLEYTPELDPSMQELITNIKESTRNTLFAMNNLLMWSKSQFMNLQTEAQIVDVNDVLDNLLTELRTPINDKALVINTTIEKGSTLYADRNHVEIILRNLLSNAIKFSPRSGEIQIKASRCAEGVEIMVRDEGKGMSHEEVESLFDSQKHFSTPGTLNEKGTGLGMLIISEFVKENKGCIKIDSEENKGSTFKVILPAA